MGRLTQSLGMEFDVGPAWWTMPAALATAIAFVVWGWRDSAGRYADSAFKRRFMQGFVVLAAVIFPIVIVGATSERVRVRGERLAVRGQFQRAMRQYDVSDVVHFGHAMRGGGPGVRGKRQHQVLVLTFRDGSVTEIPDSWANYSRLQLYLEGQGVASR
jgi:hypothetical protein